MGGLELSDEDMGAIKKAEGVDMVAPMKYKAELVKYEDQQKITLVYGVPLKEALAVFIKQMGWEVKEGRWPDTNKREVIVGSLVPEEVFPGLKVGAEITIRGKKFRVVGVMRSVGSKQDDQMVGMDMDLFDQLTGKTKGAPAVIVTIKPGFSVNEVAKNIEDKLEETRKRKSGEDLPPFSVITSEKMTGIAGNIMGIIQLAVFAFASIGVIVGGIGIMNTMYTSVHERTREIGIMKAIGAKNSTITTIFLIESGLIGLIGGIGGTILGLGLAQILAFYGQAHPLLYIEAAISPFIIIFGLGFSFLIGCISGFLPARRAARLKPVEALRYE